MMLSWLLLFAQIQAPAVVPLTEDKVILSIVDAARGLPPEFNADVYLTLAASPLISTPAAKRQLIEDAFRSAAHAELPYRHRTDGHTDARPTQRYWDNGLEALTLQTRSVESMLGLDPQRALAMYSDVSIADRRRAACEDNALPSLDLYYGTASKLVDRAFTPTMRKEGRLLMFLKERLARMKTPVDVGPALRMVLTAKLDPPEREDLVAAFTGMLSRIAESHREFLWTETMLGLDTETLRRTPALIPALRSYVVGQLSGTRCAERFDEEPRSVQRLNAAIINIDPQGLTYRPISPKESKPDRKGAAFDSEDAWQSNRSEQVLEALRWLKHGNRDLPDNQRFWTAAERSTDEWNARYQALVKILEGWKEEEERFPELYVFMVCQTYSSLAALLPPGRAQDNHVDAYLSFLEGRYSPVENRNLWFAQVKHLLGNKVFLPRFARSRNPVIATYAKLQMRLAR